jgi:hypothetical protein
MAAPLPLPVNPIGVNGYPGGIQMPDIQQVCVYMYYMYGNEGINGQMANPLPPALPSPLSSFHSKQVRDENIDVDAGQRISIDQAGELVAARFEEVSI